MKTKQITAYSCDHCNKLYQRKHSCERHEDLCYKNPENKRPCFDCPFLTKEPYEEDRPYGSYTIGNFFFCSKKEHFLISPYTQKKGNGVEDAELMPLVCGEQLKQQLNRLFPPERLLFNKEVENFDLLADSNEELAEQILIGFKERLKSNNNETTTNNLTNHF